MHVKKGLTNAFFWLVCLVVFATTLFPPLLDGHQQL